MVLNVARCVVSVLLVTAATTAAAKSNASTTTTDVRSRKYGTNTTDGQLSDDDFLVAAQSRHRGLNVVAEDLSAWALLGSSLIGEVTEDPITSEYFGAKVVLNRDGTRMVVGLGNHTNTRNSSDGSVDAAANVLQAYQLVESSSSWVKLGGALPVVLPEPRFNNARYSVDMNALGNRIIVGSPLSKQNSTSSSKSGTVEVFEWDDTVAEWKQLGQTIGGQGESDWMGESVAMNAAGNRIVAGGPGHVQDPFLHFAGKLRMYELTPEEGLWTQLGTDQEGEIPLRGLGRTVAMNAQGTIVATHSNGSGDIAPISRLYLFDTLSNDWVHLGSDISGWARTLALNGKGTRLVTGNYNTNIAAGQVKVYDFTDQDWMLISTLDGAGRPNELMLGYRVDLDDFGNRMAVGYRGTDGDSGNAIVYDYIDGDWIPQHAVQGPPGLQTPGLTPFGVVALSGDGLRMAVGNTYTGATRQGSVQVWEEDPEYCRFCGGKDPVFAFSVYEGNWHFHQEAARWRGCELASIKSAKEQAAAVAAMEPYIGFPYSTQIGWKNAFAFIGGRMIPDSSNSQTGQYVYQWSDGSGNITVQRDGASPGENYNNFQPGDPNSKTLDVEGEPGYYEPFLALSLGEGNIDSIPRGLWVDFSNIPGPALYKCCNDPAPPAGAFAECSA